MWELAAAMCAESPGKQQGKELIAGNKQGDLSIITSPQELPKMSIIAFLKQSLSICKFPIASFAQSDYNLWSKNAWERVSSGDDRLSRVGVRGVWEEESLPDEGRVARDSY